MHPRFPVPSSVSRCFKLIQRRFSASLHYTYFNKTDIVCDPVHQIKDVVETNWDSICEHRHNLLNGPIFDCLSSFKDKQTLKSTNPFYIHLLFSADGGSFVQTKKDESLWPVQLVILDLPINQRIQIHNRILFCLCKNKPNSEVIYQLLKDKMNVSFQVKDVEVKIIILTALFDLPALATFTNMTQYNGIYGCGLCLNPGERIKSGKGGARVYLPGMFNMRDDKTHKKHMDMAVLMQDRICGVKGFCSITSLMAFPSNLTFDTMHCLYEGVCKQLLNFMLDPASKECYMYIGRPNNRQVIDAFLKSIKVPHNFNKFRSFSSLSSYRAADYHDFMCYVFLPVCISSLNPDQVYHVMLLVYSLRRSNNPVITLPLASNIHSLIIAFLTLSQQAFPPTFFTMNVHLLTHLSNQLLKFGPVFALNMFCLERGMKVFKSMFSGTVCQIDQIVKNFLLFKQCHNFIFSQQNSQLFNQFQNVVNVSSAYHVDRYLDQYRYSKNNIVFHSSSYPHKKTSSSYYCYTIEKKFCEIVKFRGNHIDVKVFKKVTSLMSLVLEGISPTISVPSCLNACDEDDFTVLNLDDFIFESIPVSFLTCRCILMCIPYRRQHLDVMTCILEKR